MSKDARALAAQLRRAGFEVVEEMAGGGRTRWVAAHPAATKTVTYGSHPNKKAVLRQAGDLIGDPVLAGRNMRSINHDKHGNEQIRTDRERARLAQAQHDARENHVDVIERRRQEPPPVLGPVEAAAAIGWTFARHARDRIAERGVDTANLCRALARPEVVRSLENGQQLRATATCKVYVDPHRRLVLTVV